MIFNFFSFFTCIIYFILGSWGNCILNIKFYFVEKV